MAEAPVPGGVAYRIPYSEGNFFITYYSESKSWHLTDWDDTGPQSMQIPASLVTMMANVQKTAHLLEALEKEKS